MPHIINRLAFEMNCPDEELAFNIRTNFAVTLQDKIIAAVDRICSKVSDESDWIRIDKLELDLGSFNLSSFELEFGDIFQKKFEDEIVKHISRLSVPEKKISRQRSQIDLLKYFLQYGSLPWWADADSTDINEMVSELLRNEEKALKIFFYRQRFNKTIWQRAAFQLSRRNIVKLTSAFTELQYGMDLFTQWISRSANVSGPVLVINRQVFLSAANEILLRNAGVIFEHYPSNKPCLLIFEELARLYFPSENMFVENLIRHIKSDLPEEREVTIATINPLKEKMIIDNAVLDDMISGSYLSEDTDPPDAKLLVKHAGIVLLGAFLNHFFTNLNLLNGAEWINREAQYRAVHLLKFLSTGEQENPEFNLNLEKIICGLTPEESLPVDVFLTDSETGEAQNLLESVIEHWKILKNTSVNGLRETFLKRDGLMQKKETDWLLQVERKTLDVLIDSVPWGYSALHFPWSEHKLMVEW